MMIKINSLLHNTDLAHPRDSDDGGGVNLYNALNEFCMGGNTVKPWRNLNYDYFMQNRI